MQIRFLLAAAVFSATPLAAQVGYAPDQSPYREILRSSYYEATAGRFYGSGGALRVGPRQGPSEGLSYVIRGRNTLQLSFGLWTAGLQRSVIDPNDSIAVRDKGLVNQRLYALEIGIQFNLAGGKTWHGLAPYSGIGFGLVHGSSSPPSDSSGYSFGSRLFFAPTLGTRLFVTQRLYLKVDARAMFWKLAYPDLYLNEPSKQPGTATHSNAVNQTGSSSQYTLTPQLRIGLGFSW
jgi:hypothetical protein